MTSSPVNQYQPALSPPVSPIKKSSRKGPTSRVKSHTVRWQSNVASRKDDVQEDDDDDEDDEEDVDTAPPGAKVIEKWRWEDTIEPDESTLKEMLALAFAKGVKTVFSGHTCSFNNKVYLQQDGGAIGLPLTAAVARLICLWFDRQFWPDVLAWGYRS